MWYAGRYPFLIGLAGLAYAFGLRHAFDADHIAAIDNTTRKLMGGAARLGLDRWKRNVDDKLETLDDIYRFAVERTGMSQANILELAILLILLIELGLFFAGIMK